MRTIVLDHAQNRQTSASDALLSGDMTKMMTLARAALLNDDPQDIKGAYFKELKLELGNIVSDGYNEQARKNSCRAHLTIVTASGRQLSRDVKFTTQVSESKDQDYVLEVQEFHAFVDAVTNDMADHYAAKRLQGEWQGTYACGGIDGAASGPQGPYEMPVAVSVDGQYNAKLERTTRGGGVEVLQGQMSQFTGELELAGRGQNSPDDIWNTRFKGKVAGLGLLAAGQVSTPEGRVLRQCKLELKFTN